MRRVSALVSAYYCAPFLAGRLDNLAVQTGVEVEIVVVCQRGSAEEAVAEAWASPVVTGPMTPMLIICTTPDVPTVYGAWNRALEAASGDYVTNANADDRLDAGALARLADALDAHPTRAVAYGDCRIVESLDSPPVGTFQFAEGGLVRLLQGCFLGPMPLWRRALHATYGPFDESLHVAGDYEFWLRLAAAGEAFYKVDRVLGTYVRRPDSREHREPLRTTVETARVRARYREVQHAAG